ncbi:hypothetical protein CLV51_102577 [Chitinophaga niastensis]|uniref:Uncharacterized protein n=1 Tax=Chitinophaga niastensis TaxID=536980 RepID=A0A2P8HNC5_CHINA|nr:hypothetical protein [Chitinophaga niastensis]PSL47720.1 hypothetical protein CLV51_102577 [Chitinophaga niastensis]
MTDPKLHSTTNTYDPTKDPLYQEFLHFLQQVENKAAENMESPAGTAENPPNPPLLP